MSNDSTFQVKLNQHLSMVLHSYKCTCKLLIGGFFTHEYDVRKTIANSKVLTCKYFGVPFAIFWLWMEYRAFIITHLLPTLLRKWLYHIYVDHSIQLVDQFKNTILIIYYYLSFAKTFMWVTNIIFYLGIKSIVKEKSIKKKLNGGGTNKKDITSHDFRWSCGRNTKKYYW